MRTKVYAGREAGAARRVNGAEGRNETGCGQPVAKSIGGNANLARAVHLTLRGSCSENRHQGDSVEADAKLGVVAGDANRASDMRA